MVKAYLLVELKGIFTGYPSLLTTTLLFVLVSSMSSIGWKNFTKAVSEASPFTGASNHTVLA
jgi:hypothetical protein